MTKLPANRYARARDLAAAISAELFLHGTVTDAALQRRGFHPDEIRDLYPAALAMQARRPVTLNADADPANAVR
ncbi:hypothetical protein [Magnetospirillum sp. UT-4]|uniref:hypothetical protein n=1 Tax=Magnetospirillum sp. UT-4 TaxID=2681467 RepID=UPI00138259C4|nr:hypothetical protein [Magnetospirillum sp. UT-4]CAA7621088.1 hypothetical protein MTBUT4_380003 [Magnetospirillum sp. UT-4]